MTPRPARKTETAANGGAAPQARTRPSLASGVRAPWWSLPAGAVHALNHPPTTPGRADEMVICARVTGSSDQPQFPSPGP